MKIIKHKRANGWVYVRRTGEVTGSIIFHPRYRYGRIIDVDGNKASAWFSTGIKATLGKMGRGGPPDNSSEHYVPDVHGKSHFGIDGAAGLIIYNHGADGEVRYLLQQRGEGVNLSGTWSTPGGGLHRGESPVCGAKREAIEELGSAHIKHLKHTAIITVDYGGWQYHTVLMESPATFTPDASDATTADESVETRWVTVSEAWALPLHPGFAASFSHIQAVVAEVSGTK
jgi:8-oxo-dGTP diphosphatase